MVWGRAPNPAWISAQGVKTRDGVLGGEPRPGGPTGSWDQRGTRWGREAICLDGAEETGRGGKDDADRDIKGLQSRLKWGNFIAI